jgi:hypothetical protein
MDSVITAVLEGGQLDAGRVDQLLAPYRDIDVVVL